MCCCLENEKLIKLFLSSSPILASGNLELKQRHQQHGRRSGQFEPLVLRRSFNLEISSHRLSMLEGGATVPHPTHSTSSGGIQVTGGVREAGLQRGGNAAEKI